jgi:hypothetical protein
MREGSEIGAAGIITLDVNKSGAFDVEITDYH